MILGNHRDAWVFGGVDPSSGSASLMETARAFGELKRGGWKPRRTLIFASWDAEEFTLTGSTEWGELEADRLRAGALAYLNVDSSSSGSNFTIAAVPALAVYVGSSVSGKFDRYPYTFAVHEPLARAILVWRGDENKVPGSARQLGIGAVSSIGECLDILDSVDDKNAEDDPYCDAQHYDHHTEQDRLHRVKADQLAVLFHQKEYKAGQPAQYVGE